MNLEYNTLVTVEDYLQATGIDLNTELQSLSVNDLGDNPAPRFIYGIEQWCLEKLTTPPYEWDGEFANDKQKEYFKKGVIYQIQYVLLNGSIDTNSGYNQNSGTIIPLETLEKIALAPNAKRCFRKYGLMNASRWNVNANNWL